MSLCNLKETLRSRFIDVHLNVQMHIGWSLFLDILWLINSMDMELIVGFFRLETSWRKHCYSAWSPDCRSISCNVRPSSKGFPGRMGDSWIFDLQFGQNVVFPQALSNLTSSPVVLNANQTTHPIGRRGTFANKQHLLPLESTFSHSQSFWSLPRCPAERLGGGAWMEGYGMLKGLGCRGDDTTWSLQGTANEACVPAWQAWSSYQQPSSIYFTCYKYTYHFMKCWSPLQTESQCNLQPPCPHPSDLRL